LRCAITLLLSASAFAASVRGTVEVNHASKAVRGNADVVVWLTPVSAQVTVAPTRARLTQQDKRFIPHVLAVPVGTEIEFPNKDPFFHNVFSIYRGKPFDLGLYESGRSRSVRFDHPGVSYIFCNIHPEMSAVVVALTTPYFAITKSDGSFELPNVPSGNYRMQMFYERASASELESAAQDVQVVNDSAPLKLQLQSSDTPDHHLNKYGERYAPEKRDKY
jgi:plastocyanin